MKETKHQIIERLIKEGSLTLDEALLLLEKSVQYAQVSNPNHFIEPVKWVNPFNVTCIK